MPRRTYTYMAAYPPFAVQPWEIYDELPEPMRWDTLTLASAENLGLPDEAAHSFRNMLGDIHPRPVMFLRGGRPWWKCVGREGTFIVGRVTSSDVL